MKGKIDIMPPVFDELLSYLDKEHNNKIEAAYRRSLIRQNTEATDKMAKVLKYATIVLMCVLLAGIVNVVVR